MKILTTIFIIFCTIKSIFYANYEFKENNNKTGSLFIVFFSLIGIILNTYLIFL